MGPAAEVATYPQITVASYHFGNYHPGDPRSTRMKGKDWSIKSARPLIAFSLPAFLSLEIAQGAVAGQFKMAIGDQTFHLFVMGGDLKRL